MKRIIKLYIHILLFSCLMVSCESYLDKAPEVEITEKQVFGSFNTFQGFIEQMCNCVTDMLKNSTYYQADECLDVYPFAFDSGNYWDGSGFLTGGPGIDVRSNDYEARRIWEWGWYGIAIANLALQKIDEPDLFEGTQEQYNLLKGQALFFRGFFYFQICRFWGGMPYITRVLESDELFGSDEFARLNFKETAIKMAADFRAAADILPDHWDRTPSGQLTLGHNRDRINKFFGLGFLGLTYLWGASPMINEEATGVNAFDPVMCAQAADAFGELLRLRDNTQLYAMAPFDRYLEIFYRHGNYRPGLDEVIMSPTPVPRDYWMPARFLPSDLGLSFSNCVGVTHNYTKNFGCKEGFPIDDDLSVYNENDPWENRDPRFYKVIVYDNVQMHSIEKAGTETVSQLYNGGYHRAVRSPFNVTGYYTFKFSGLNTSIVTDAIISTVRSYIPYLRLADVYLMYAEAVNFQTGGGPKATSSNYSMTAEDAINMVRNRAELPDIHAKFTANSQLFFEEIIRERAVELCFEWQRFSDLRRWNRNGDPRYLQKTVIRFDRDANQKPVNLVEEVMVTRVAEKRHNWVPIPTSYTVMYKNFPQNPGW